jgi:hypothetical protein
MNDMLCPFCNAFRPANKGLCPQCKAPSPLALAGKTGSEYQASQATWGGPISPTSGSGWTHQAPEGSLRGEANDNSLWGQVMAPQAVPGSGFVEQQEPSLLPMPYPGGAGAPQHGLYVMPPDLPTIHTGGEEGSLVPATPGEEGPIYVPPMYTKPRAIIPRYRAISGLISFFIVFALLCTGAAYYARATGKLHFLHQIYGDARPDNVKATPIILPTPQIAPVYGPASRIINSATTASKIDTTTAQPLNPTNQFKAGDTIYLTYSVHPKSPGSVTVKWYTNSYFYQQSKPIPITDAVSGYVPIQFLQPEEGMVELYWNDQLAVRLYFVVEPKAA